MKPKEMFEQNPEQQGKWNCSSWSASLAWSHKAIDQDKGQMMNDMKAHIPDLGVIKKFDPAKFCGINQNAPLFSNKAWMKESASK